MLICCENSQSSAQRVSNVKTNKPPVGLYKYNIERAKGLKKKSTYISNNNVITYI